MVACHVRENHCDFDLMSLRRPLILPAAAPRVMLCPDGMSCGCLALGDVQTLALQSSAFRLSNIASIFCAGIFSKKKTS
jgi:hypothetical protein